MDMASYLSEIRHACESVLPSVWSEWDAVEALKGKIASLTAATVEGYRRAEAFQQFEDTDDYMLGVGIHWDTYFGPDKERYHAKASLPDLEQQRDVRAFACTSLAGSVLQFAKQGISLVHGGIQNCPSGRIVHGVELKSVIWQGRNQSMHWEEGQLRPAVRQCFKALNAADPALGDYLQRNVAFEVVRLLEWREFADFEADLLLLA
ncbi:hypothetical protein EV659_11428 [Rhodothalassium salexigens DSM 2132]|uniref:Uncharacterized protein n=1 Tax=Rhodothalassium salexigens DSM 2132 TaxID=1188247 RepID=A0A4R2P6C6_RHOSA|nr:hypothetical protein [Rhodothalassium salexigens]MBB4212686.1 hypothetical protein [Rhodothalassium salexigens DSM 2132]TCP30439.1 hypothetical protein EV659_11428 [Rhodothalassium salexigens DSM 2132]